MRRWRVSAAVAATVALAGAASAQAATVTVGRGETLGAIAARAGVSVGALARENGIANPNRVMAGRVLRLPGTGAAPAPAAAPGAARHRVRPGETLSAIAARYGIGVGTLARLNGLADPQRIIAGRVLRLPASAPAAPPAVPRPSRLPRRPSRRPGPTGAATTWRR